jgi:hypothetical protein
MTIEKTDEFSHILGNNPTLALTTFGKWWNPLRPLLKVQIIFGMLFFVIGTIDLLRMALGGSSLLFWTNDLFALIGGLILAAAGISYGLRSEK